MYSSINNINSFALLGASLYVMTKLFAEGALSMIVWDFGIDWLGLAICHLFGRFWDLMVTAAVE